MHPKPWPREEKSFRLCRSVSHRVLTKTGADFRQQGASFRVRIYTHRFVCAVSRMQSENRKTPNNKGSKLKIKQQRIKVENQTTKGES